MADGAAVTTVARAKRPRDADPGQQLAAQRGGTVTTSRIRRAARPQPIPF